MSDAMETSAATDCSPLIGTQEQARWLERRVAELERALFDVRRAGRMKDVSMRDKIIEMRSAACRPRIDESQYRQIDAE